MSLKLGMPQLLEFQSLEENVRIASQFELDFLELNLNLPYMQTHLLNADELKHLKERYQMTFTAHLPEELDLGHFNPHIRSAYLHCLKESIKFAQAAGIETLNLHMNKGIIFTMPSHQVEIYEKYETQYLTHIEESLKEIYSLLEASNVNLVIENTGLYNRNHICKGVEILLNHPKINLTWDVGHDRVHHYVDEKFMNLHHDRVKHFHLHDANERNDHLELLTGDIGFKKYFDLAKVNDATCVIEVKTANGLVNSLDKIRSDKNHTKLGFKVNTRQKD